MLELGWGDEDSAFMRSFATQFQPDGGMEHLSSWCELQRQATTARNAVALTRIMFDIDVTDEAARIASSALVAHVQDDAVVPATEAELLARTIPGASLLLLPGRNHFMLPHEESWKRLTDELAAFLPTDGNGLVADLSQREREVLEGVAGGLDNREIGVALNISEKTVRNHVSGILSKLGVPSRAKAMVRAIQAGLGGRRS